jgi:protein ImuB
MIRIACLHAPNADATVQSALLDIALRHSPSVEDAAPGVVFLDLRGLGKLWGGEEELARRLLQAVAERGGRARVGIAGSRAAARFAARAGEGITIVPPGRDAGRLGPAPLALLDLGPEMAARLARWGIRTLGELADLPARGLAQRLGDAGPRLQRLARGEDPTPLRLWTPPPVFEESAQCAWGIEALEPLGDLVAGLAEALCARLRRDELTADAFAWTCRLADGTAHEGFCAPAAPLADPAAAAAMLRASLAARPPRAAVEEVTLRAHPLRAPKAQPRFDEAPGPSPRLLTAALARLSGLVGSSGIGSPELLDSHRPDALRMTPFVLFPSPRPSPPRASAEIEQGTVLAARRIRPPRPAQVTLESGAPVHLRATGLAGRVVTGAGPWRVSGEWWSDEAFVQDEWDVELSDGTLCRLARDRRGWRLDAIYD